MGGVEHEVAVEAIGMSGDGRGDTFFITRHAGDEGGALHVGAREFSGPTSGESGGIGERNFVVQKRCEVFGVGELLLLRESGVELVREEVDVGILDCQFAPGSLRHAAVIVAGEKRFMRNHP